eukprot:TRINITY_DN111957_c0_g1_i1.p1 TRINITY_DN111957_c0_g1~~TRINITY_DN111957_c0_g1_i1.p1  ORF type:complete len:189 (-),score=60.56 TRINITY_DN111957_c0_g1_i1:63-629(-)
MGQDTEAADYTVDSPHSSSEDEDGPPLDPYWASLLNVSAVAAPPAPVKPEQPKAAAARQEAGKGNKGADKGTKGGGKGKGGSKGSKKSGKKGAASQPAEKSTGYANDIGDDFIPLAKDARADWSSRPPKRPREAEGLESFMSWAKEAEDDRPALNDKDEAPDDDDDSDDSDESDVDLGQVLGKFSTIS